MKDKSKFSIFEFDLIKDIQVMIKTKWKKMIILLCAFMGFILIYLFFLNFNTASVNITFRYSGIGKGLNPDGTRFNIYEVLSDDVLGEVVTRLGNKKVTIDYLRNNLIIRDNIAPSRQAEVENAIFEGQENYNCLPSAYTISYSQVIGPFGAGEILNTLATVYKQYFLENHIRKTNVLTPGLNELLELDYINGADKLETQLVAMRNYLNKRQLENSKFISKSSNKSYSDLVSLVDSMINVDLATYKSYIIKSSLSKDLPSLFMQYKYAIEKNEVAYKKYTAGYEVAMQGLGIYDQTVTKVVFIPTVDESNEYYMSRTKTGIDYLTESASSNLTSMETTRKKIEEYNYLVNNFNTGIAPDSICVDVADSMLSNLMARIAEVSTLSLQTENDYINEQERSVPKFSVTSFGLDLTTAINYLLRALILGTLISYIVIYITERVIRIFKSKRREIRRKRVAKRNVNKGEVQ